MLRITQNTSAAGAMTYYTTADYYTEGQELEGRWRGKGAELLALGGVVKKADWDALCNNRNPTNGEQLTLRQKKNRRVGFDFNFHVPKSVSLLYGQTKDDRILDAFRESVDDTMRDMEAEMKTRVRKSGKDEDRTTGNMIWGEFVHFTARPIGGIPDPHLHAHCFVFNTTQDSQEKAWKAGQFADLKRDAPYFEGRFHSRLSKRLADLGLGIERTKTGWEIAGIPKSALSRFSRRTAAIEEEARRKGIVDPAAKSELGAKTRESKAKELTFDQLQAEWSSRLKRDGNYVRLSNVCHTAVFAPTGAGKGVSCVIPFLLDRPESLVVPESCVVVDFKGENALLTMKQRRRMGHRVVLLDPYRMVTDRPDTLNPIASIRKGSPHVIDEIRDLAESFVIRNPAEKEPHWADSAETWISAAIAAVVEYGDADDRSLQTVRDLLSSGPDKLQLMIKLLCESEACEGMVSRLGYQLTNFKEKELASTLTTVNRYLRNLDTLAVAASTKTSTFNPADLLKGKMTIFLVLPPEHARTQSPLLRTWISTLLRAVVRGGLQERTKVHFLLDEAASLGHLESLDDAVDKYRGYGVRLTFIYQSLGQLKRCFPEGQDTTLLSNVSQVFFGVNEPQTAEYVSNRLGEATIVVKSGGVSRGTSQQYSNRDSSGSYSTSWNGNDNWQQQGRKLLRPEEVMALPPRMAITFVAGMPPIRTWLIRYYEERPASALRRLIAAIRATWLAMFLLVVGAIAAKQAQSIYEYQVRHPPVPMHVPNRRVPFGR